MPGEAERVVTLFNDRRSRNAPMGQTPSQQRAKHAPIYESVHDFGGDSYLGQGASIPNGSLPPRIINGKSYTRDNPDTAGLQRSRLKIGERNS